MAVRRIKLLTSISYNEVRILSTNDDLQGTNKYLLTKGPLHFNVF
jgi:hypothetical protein